MRLRQRVFWGVLACSAMQAHAIGRLADVRIIDRDTGATMHHYHHQGEIWVAGTPGARYAIALRSRARERVLAVTSVDGVNVLSGATAAWDQTGYVLSPRQRYQVTGWRKSSREVAAFEFAHAGASYAARTGRPDHVGVVGVALFREVTPSAPAVEPEAVAGPADRSLARRERADEAPSPAASERESADQGNRSAHSSERAGKLAGDSQTRSSLAEPAPRLGTGHGARENSWVTYTRFERAQQQPDEVIRIRYDSRDNLIARGVIAAPHYQGLPPYAKAFPQSEPAPYVPDPPPLR